MSEPREQLKFAINVISTLVTTIVAAIVTWVGTEVKTMGQAIVRLETIQEERTSQLRRVDAMVTQIVPRAEIETKLLDINTQLSSQKLETSRLNLEIEKLKSFNSLTHGKKTQE